MSGSNHGSAGPEREQRVAVEAPAAPLAPTRWATSDAGCVPVNVAPRRLRYGPSGVRHGGRDRMGHKHQARLVCSLPSVERLK